MLHLTQLLYSFSCHFLHLLLLLFLFFFFNDTATTEIYTLSLHDALPIYGAKPAADLRRRPYPGDVPRRRAARLSGRSEEHTSELQSQSNLVCRLLLEKKKKKNKKHWSAVTFVTNATSMITVIQSSSVSAH